MAASEKASTPGAKATPGKKVAVKEMRKIRRKPWWETDGRHKGAGRIPDTARRWMAVASRGDFREVTVSYDPKSKSTRVVQDIGEAPILDIDDLKAVWESGIGSGKSVMEVFIAERGEDSLPVKWQREAMEHADVGFPDMIEEL
jgi:hypothetical protein